MPTPGKDLNEHDVLVKVAAGSLCHTDGMVLEGIMGGKLPCIAFHEGAGTVVKVGSAVEFFKVGDRVLCNLTYHRCSIYADCIVRRRIGSIVNILLRWGSQWMGPLLNTKSLMEESVPYCQIT